MSMVSFGSVGLYWKLRGPREDLQACAEKIRALLREECLIPSRCAHLFTGTNYQYCGNAKNKNGIVADSICKSMGLYETAEDVRARSSERSGNVRKDL